MRRDGMGRDGTDHLSRPDNYSVRFRSVKSREKIRLVSSTRDQNWLFCAKKVRVVTSFCSPAFSSVSRRRGLGASHRDLEETSAGPP